MPTINAESEINVGGEEIFRPHDIDHNTVYGDCSSSELIFNRTNCVVVASGTVVPCPRASSCPVRLRKTLGTGISYIPGTDVTDPRVGIVDRNLASPHLHRYGKYTYPKSK